jgi:anaerobic selenocysteine-containing dehydrogenase
MTTTHYRACNLCAAICGLEITVEDGTVKNIVGDKNDPFSRGHICPKAVAMKDIYEDPNRLKLPIKRTENGWKTITWEEAYEEVVNKLQEIQAKNGKNSVAVYQGNPSIHNLGTSMNSPAFVKSLGTKNVYSATSTDQLPHHFASCYLFGHPMLLPVPDIDHTDYMLIMGGNPLVSNGSMMTVPDVAKRLRAIQERGGKVVVIDPRKTETADKASSHHFIIPSTDVFLLLAMIHTLFDENLINLKHLADFTDGVEDLKSISQDFSAEKMAKITCIPAEEIKKISRDFAQAKSAVLYGRIGLSTQTFGGLCQWLINAINILTGNLDKQGGAMFAKPAFDFLARARTDTRFNRWQSRVRHLPEFLGELPVSALCEEIETEGQGQIKALITSCGNPVLSITNGAALDKALENIEFMVAIDIYINETTRHAHIILPPATGLEVSHYDTTFNILAVRNTAKYSLPTMPKAEGAKFDWDIFQELTHRFTQNPESFVPEPPEQKLDAALRVGPYKLTLQDLKEAPQGIDLGELKPCLPERLLTENKRINLVPEILVKDLERAKSFLETSQTSQEMPFLLIGRRHLRSNNSWMHNAERLMKGNNRCTLQINPIDAQVLQLMDKQIVSVTSRVGKIEVPVEITHKMLQGVVSMPHGYGHNRKGVQLDIAQKHAGVSVNDLTDEMQIDELTGNSAFSNVAVGILAL